MTIFRRNFRLPCPISDGDYAFLRVLPRDMTFTRARIRGGANGLDDRWRFRFLTLDGDDVNSDKTSVIDVNHDGSTDDHVRMNINETIREGHSLGVMIRTRNGVPVGRGQEDRELIFDIELDDGL